MHRIDTPTAQKDKFGAGKNGFTRGNPQTGTPATDLDDDYFDMLQEELAGVVEATGVNLDKSKHNQLLTALKALLLSRAHPFADIKADGPAAIAEALSNLGLVTPMSGAKWRKTADGYIEQWGTSAGAVSGRVTVTFPIPFPTACESIQLTEVSGGAPGDGTIGWGVNPAFTKTGFIAVSTSNLVTEPVMWRALGQ